MKRCSSLNWLGYFLSKLRKMIWKIKRECDKMRLEIEKDRWLERDWWKKKNFKKIEDCSKFFNSWWISKKEFDGGLDFLFLESIMKI